MRRGATYAVDWPLRANEWRVAGVGRSKILARRIKSQMKGPAGRYRGITTAASNYGCARPQQHSNFSPLCGASDVFSESARSTLTPRDDGQTAPTVSDAKVTSSCHFWYSYTHGLNSLGMRTPSHENILNATRIALSAGWLLLSDTLRR